MQTNDQQIKLNIDSRSPAYTGATSKYFRILINTTDIII